MSEIQLPQHKIDKLLEICDAHGNQPGELINVLHKAQHLFGYLPAEVQRIVADKLNIPVSKVYGVVTFYDRLKSTVLRKRNPVDFYILTHPYTYFFISFCLHVIAYHCHLHFNLNYILFFKQIYQL